MAKKSQIHDRQHSFSLIEEAFYLLRSAPPSTHALYLIGVVPFMLGLAFFCADMATLSRDAVAVSTGVLKMVLLYAWMTLWKSLYGRALYRELLPDGEEEVKGTAKGGGLAESVQRAAALFVTMVFSLPLHFIGTFLLIPMAWIVAFYHNVCILAFLPGREKISWSALNKDAFQLAKIRTIENHGVLFLLSLFGLFVWLNTAILVSLLPRLVKSFTGIESTFTLNPEAALMNTTTLAVTIALTVIAMGPMMKAVYVLRCFYGMAESTGIDLVSRLAVRVKADAVSAVRGLGIVAVAFTVGAAPTDVQAASDGQKGAGDPISESRVAAMDAAMKEVLQSERYRWRLPPKKGGDNEEEDADESLVAAFFESIAESISGAVKYVFRSIGDLLEKLFSGSPPLPSGKVGWQGASAGIGLLRAALWIGGIALVVFLSVFAWRSYRGRTSRGVGEASVGAQNAVDLESEDLLADALEENEWIALAHEKRREGDYRLAVRAVFLACLAHLAERELVRLRRSKSNADYLSEIKRSARHKAALIGAFGETTDVFERTWYGEHIADGTLVTALELNFNQIVDTP